MKDNTQEKSLSDIEFWEREKDRCESGLWRDGIQLETGIHYFYRTYISISSSERRNSQRSLSITIETKAIIDQYDDLKQRGVSYGKAIDLPFYRPDRFKRRY